MKIKYYFLIISLLLFISAGNDTKGIKVVIKDIDPDAIVGKQYVALIAIDKYKFWYPLKKPVSDLKEIKEILIKNYFIDEVKELYDEQATKENILKLLTDLKKELKTNDSLLLLYSGHGHLDKNTNTGFWIPVDAGTDEFKQENWLPNIQIRGLISSMDARHICLISDSCFSGDILNIFRAKPEEIKIDNQYYKNAYQGISRQVLTSGVSQVVPDESEFAMQLKLILKGNNNKIIDPLMIYNDLRKGVTKTTPLFGNLAATGHQEGASFLLFKKSDSVNLIEEKKQETKKITMTEEEKAKEYGSVKIEVKENGKLYIDNEFIGEIKSDKLVTLNNILTGRHIIKIDYQDKVETQDINIEKGAVKSINFIYVRQKEKSLLIDNKVITNVMKKEFEYKNKNFIENFDKIKVGLSPRDWYNIYSEPGLYYEVVDSKTINPHSFPNCLKLYDNSEIKAVKIRKDIGDHNYGQVKFYFYIQDIKNIFFFSLKDVHSKNLFMVFIGRDNGSIDILINNGNYKAIGSFKYYNEWNEFVIKYDRISGYYNLICNGINYGIYELNIDQKPYLIEFQGGVVKATFSNIELQNGTVLSYPYKLKKNITVFIDDIEFTTYKETIKF